MPIPRDLRPLAEERFAALVGEANARLLMRADEIHHLIAQELQGDKSTTSEWRFHYDPKNPKPWQTPNMAEAVKLAKEFHDIVKSLESVKEKLMPEFPMLERAAELCTSTGWTDLWDAWDWMTSAQVPLSERILEQDIGWNDEPLKPKYTLADLKEEPMPTELKTILNELLIAEENELEDIELLKRQNLARQKMVKDALTLLDIPPVVVPPLPPIEPPKPPEEKPIINDILVSEDRRLITVHWSAWGAVNVTTSNGVKTATGKDEASPLNIAVGSGLAEGFTVVNDAFEGAIIVTLSNAGGSTTGQRFIAPTKPTTPEIPTKPVEPNSFPFPLQNRGETPKLIRKPDEIIDITDLAQGSHREMNHPSRRGFSADGKRCIAGSARTIINLETKQREFVFSGVDNVTWSAVEPNTAWGVRKVGTALVRYKDGKLEDWITAKSLGYDRIDVEAEGEIVDKNDEYAFVRLTKSGKRYLAFINLIQKSLDEFWAIDNTNFDCWAIDQSGDFGVLDTLPASTENGKWRIFHIDGIRETKPLGTKHFCTGDTCLIDVNGMFFDLVYGEESSILKGVGNGVSNGQQVNYLSQGYVVWTQGGKSAAKKQIDLVNINGLEFAYLMETSGGINGGEIYASASLAPDGTFYLGYCEGNRTKVAVWRRS